MTPPDPWHTALLLLAQEAWRLDPATVRVLAHLTERAGIGRPLQPAQQRMIRRLVETLMPMDVAAELYGQLRLPLEDR